MALFICKKPKIRAQSGGRLEKETNATKPPKDDDDDDDRASPDIRIRSGSGAHDE
jgi:hypothetical protein